MASLEIRDVDEVVMRELNRLAQENGTSAEEEAHAVLTRALRPQPAEAGSRNVGLAFLEIGRRYHGVDHLEELPRSMPSRNHANDDEGPQL